MAIIQIAGFRCERCDKVWAPKSVNQDDPSKVEMPVICPKCKSPYWNRPRKET